MEEAWKKYDIVSVIYVYHHFNASLLDMEIFCIRTSSDPWLATGLECENRKHFWFEIEDGLESRGICWRNAADAIDLPMHQCGNCFPLANVSSFIQEHLLHVHVINSCRFHASNIHFSINSMISRLQVFPKTFTTICSGFCFVAFEFQFYFAVHFRSILNYYHHLRDKFTAACNEIWKNIKSFGKVSFVLCNNCREFIN